MNELIVISVLLANISHAKSSWGLDQIESKQALHIANDLSEVIVAVIDTGVDVRHSDLAGRIWMNPNEKLNGIDDDKNGFVDDISGWSFVDQSNNIVDNHGHGTHVAAIIAGRESGVSPNAKIMVLKYTDPKRFDFDASQTTVRAIEYATKMGAHIINYSSGGYSASLEEKEAIRKAAEKGVLFIAAAGNDGLSTDRVPFYPASYGLKNIIAVSAGDSARRLLRLSNYGAKSATIVAPGKDVESALPSEKYGRMSGTSQATAFVSGSASVIMSNFGFQFKPEAVKEQLSISDGFLNLFQALKSRPLGAGLFGAEVLEPISDDGLFFSSQGIH